MIIDLIRHTKPEIEEGICYGQTDLSLADSFDKEFAQMQSKIRSSYDLVISSPLQRCLHLAKNIIANTDLDVLLDNRIMEYDFGDWELLPWNEFKDDASKAWMDNFVDQPAPNGDSILTMQARVLEFWNQLISDPENHDKSIAVVTHSGVQRLIHAHILHTPLAYLFRLQLDFGAVIRVTIEPKRNFATLKHQ